MRRAIDNIKWASAWTARRIAVLAVLLAGVKLTAGTAGLIALAVVPTVLAVIWSRLQPDTFNTWVTARARASWRRDWVYSRNWRAAMFLSGLACRFDGGEIVPKLGRVRCSWASDRVEVRLTAAQESIDWEHRSGALAQTFGAIECSARATRAHWIELDLTFRRDIPEVPALAVPARPDLEGLPIGRRGDGRRWLLRLHGTHVLVGGATDSGKGSVLWSIIRSLVSWTHQGLAQLWVADPKGGVELGHGHIDPATGNPSCPLFSRFARTPEAIADMLDAAVELMLQRAARLAGVARHHTPTLDDPVVVIIIDELAHLATYEAELLRERIRSALGLLLSEGRALGFHVVAAIQNPGQLKADFRRAFPTRICLRTVDEDQVEMILGRDAWARGARCERIAHSTPGCGWMVLDGEREPTWVRASWISDDDINAMAATHPAAKPPADDHDVDVDGDRPEDVDLEAATTGGAG